MKIMLKITFYTFLIASSVVNSDAIPTTYELKYQCILETYSGSPDEYFNMQTISEVLEILERQNTDSSKIEQNKALLANSRSKYQNGESSSFPFTITVEMENNMIQSFSVKDFAFPTENAEILFGTRYPWRFTYSYDSKDGIGFIQSDCKFLPDDGLLSNSYEFDFLNDKAGLDVDMVLDLFIKSLRTIYKYKNNSIDTSSNDYNISESKDSVKIINTGDVIPSSNVERKTYKGIFTYTFSNQDGKNYIPVYMERNFEGITKLTLTLMNPGNYN